MIFAGIDAGSRAIKIALCDESKKILSSGIKDQGVNQEVRTRELFDELLKEIDSDQSKVSKIIATGYGRDRIAFADTTITEITCHAAGVRSFIPDAATVIDIGGQDSKLIRLDSQGRVRDFVMNDRCAAGTGSFLEMTARKLEVDISELGEMAKKSQSPSPISSMCVVFAETEIIGLLARGDSPEDIVAGVQDSIASRIKVMAGRAVQPPVVLTGGVALVPGMKESLAKALDSEIIIPERPQMTGAVGAAVLAVA